MSPSPKAFVFFGILHCIALRQPDRGSVSSPLACRACGRRLPRWRGIPLVPVPQRRLLQWIGLSTSELLTEDWRPLFPLGRRAASWRGGGKLLLVYDGRAVASSRPYPTSGAKSWLPFLGRHSLIIYLAHQPALFALFLGLAYLAPPPTDTRDFVVASCEARCFEEGGEGKLCHDACECTGAGGDQQQGARRRDGRSERGRRLNEIAERCVAKGGLQR
ncbi:MAG: heparan-alpha-glucosaminide N-acetyltransferase domain-containing protein [Methylocystis sp.]